MNEKQIIRAVLKREGKTQTEISKEVGLSERSVGTMLCRPNTLSLWNVYGLLNALGYEIVVRPKDRANEVEFVISEDDSPIECERYVSEETLKRIAAKQAETEAEMEQIKRMIRK